MIGEALARLRWLLAAAALAGPAGLHSQQSQVVKCEQCHGNREFIAAFDSALYVPAAILQDTRHAALVCADCHRGFEAGYPHRVAARAVACQGCHEAEGRDWAASIHAPTAAATGDAPTCTGCHGSHGVYGVMDRQSPSHPLNVAVLCGRCHGDPRIIGTYFTGPRQAQARTAVAEYYQTVHGHALSTAGLTVSATCNDCHRAHKVLPADSVESSVHRKNIPTTCGACHVGVAEVYERSAHGVAARQGRRSASGRAAPVCVDCHSAHGIVRADQPQWLLGVVEECGSCHERLYQTYFETYHGKVTRLGFTIAAKCSDCHTPHNMRPASDPESSVFPTKLVATCGQCHAAASANFVRYAPHADPADRARNAALFWTWFLMQALLAAVLIFFGIHTLLWLLRLALDRRRRMPPAGRPESTEATP